MAYDNSSTVTRSLLLGAGGLLACFATVRYLAYRDEAEHRPIGRFLNVRGHRLQVLDRGTGPCLVFLHGNGATIEEIQASGLVDDLAADHRVIVLDRPGFGLSERPSDENWTPELEAEFLAEALTMLGVESPVIIGHSWGALVATNLALAQQGATKALILLSGYYAPTARLDVALQTPVTIPIVGDMLRHTLLPLAARLAAGAGFKKMFSPLPVSEAFLANYPIGLACRPSQLKSVADDTVEMPKAAARLRSRYQDLSIPIHLIAGAEDKVMATEAQSGWLHTVLPASTLQVLAGVGHMVHHAQPVLIAAAVRAAASAGPLDAEPAEAQRAAESDESSAGPNAGSALNAWRNLTGSLRPTSA